MNAQQRMSMVKDIVSMTLGAIIVLVQAFTGKWNVGALGIALVFMGVPLTNIPQLVSGLISNSNGSDTPESSSPSRRSRRSQSSSSSSSPRQSTVDSDSDTA